MDFFLYLKIIRFNFQIFFAYPLELVAFIARYIVKVGFILFFWNIVGQGTNLGLNQNELLSYFLLSSGISDLLMADNTNLGRTIRKAVRRGDINQVLVKPVALVQYFYAETVGTIGIKLILAIFSIILGIIINPPTNPIAYILFFFFMIVAFFIAFSYNLFEGALSLIFTEVGGIKNAMHHVTRVLSGQLVPFTFFNEGLRTFLLLTPIPTMIYGPINALKQSGINPEILNQLLIGTIWAIILNILVFKFWKSCLKKYDAAGN